MENIYPEDFFLMSRQIRLRHIDETLLQVRVISHPHIEEEAGKEFIDDLIEQGEWYRGDPRTRDTLDRTGLEGFKQQVRQNSRFGKVRQKGEKKDDGVLE